MPCHFISFLIQAAVLQNRSIVVCSLLSCMPAANVSKQSGGDTVKLSYFELLSKDPIYLPNAGGILSPTLKEISALGIHTYHYYLTVLLMDLKTCFSILGLKDEFELYPEEDRSKLSIFDLLLINASLCTLLTDILNFFIKEDVIYSPEQKCFFIQQGNEISGRITKENYPQICDVICQRNNIKSNLSKDPSEVKSKKASEILKKLQKGRAKKAGQTKADENLELGNIISAVAGKSHSLNLLNIWNLTIFQLWDCFARLSNNSIYDIQSMSVAAWGNKDNYFDATAWFKRIYTDN